MGCKAETRLTQGPWKFLHGSWLGRESRKDRTRERKEKALGPRPGEGREESAEMGARRVEDNKEDPRKTRQRALRSLEGVTREDGKI